MLTYDRFEIACRTLEGFLNLPYVHSVVVVWNHPTPPRRDLPWPQLHVSVKVSLVLSAFLCFMWAVLTVFELQ